MIVALYAAALAVSLVVLIIFLRNGSRKDICQILLMLSVLISCGGYFAVATCNNAVPAALLGNDIAYLGVILSLVLLVFFMADQCEIRIPVWVRTVQIILSAFIFVCVCLAGRNDWYYITESIYLKKFGGAYIIKTDYGPCHMLFYVFLIGSFVAICAMLLYAGFKKPKISRRVIRELAIVVGICAVLFILQAIINPPFDLMPMIFAVMEIALLRIMMRIENYYVDSTIGIVLAEREGYGFAIFDTELRYLHSNNVMRELLPVLQTAPADKKLETIGNEEIDNMLEMLGDVDLPNHLRVVVPMGERIYQVTMSNYINEKEKRLGYLMEMVDETAQYKQMEELEQYSQKMEEAKKDAENANRAKSDFLSNMSHEMRTPLNAIIGMDEMILRQTEKDEIIGYALMIQNSSEGLLSLINDILDISKIESGKMEIVCTEYDLLSVCTDAYNMVSDRAAKKDLELTFHCEEKLPKQIYGDPVRVRQILLNILTNAIKYTKEGYVRTEVSGIDVGDTLMLEIKVTDTGIGMTQENLKKLFDKFERFDMNENRSIEGTGLGMSITKELLRLMGGTIDVESEYGKGSVFTVTIPQKVVDVEPIGKVDITAQSTKSQRKYYRESFTAPEAQILVVDDVESNLKVVRALLRETKIKIDTATRGREAIELAQKKHYDMIFMDHMMPEMDGMETFAKLQKIPENKNKETPVIMLTANAITGEREKYLEAGFADYLTKPIRSEELEQMLIDYLPKDKVFLAGNEEGGEIKEREKKTVGAADGYSADEKEKAEEKAENAALPEEETDITSLSPLQRVAKILEVNLSSALSYCMDDEEFLWELLRDFAHQEICEDIPKLYEQKDWENYRIAVHALKSTAKTVGLDVLSALAKDLEFAQKDGDIDFILNHHEEMMDVYAKVINTILREEE